MFGKTFYHGMTRRYVVMFGTLFNDIIIERNTDDPDVKDTIKVPITYASQDKMLSRVFGDESLDRKYSARSPSLSFEMGAPKYDPERKQVTTHRYCYNDPTNGHTFSYLGVPYNIPFSLYIYAREEEDGLRVLEQILPYFTPALNLSVHLLDELNLTKDVPIILDSVDFKNDSYGEMLNRRKLIWTLNFTVKVEFVGPVITGKKIIRTTHVNIRDFMDEAILEEVHIEPGLTANGEPTSIRSESIDKEDINEDDNYGYIVDINEGPNPHE